MLLNKPDCFFIYVYEKNLTKLMTARLKLYDDFDLIKIASGHLSSFGSVE